VSESVVVVGEERRVYHDTFPQVVLGKHSDFVGQRESVAMTCGMGMGFRLRRKWERARSRDSADCIVLCTMLFALRSIPGLSCTVRRRFRCL
jgi:hypothetical protein